MRAAALTAIVTFRSLMANSFFIPGGFAPPDPPARALARRCDGALPIAWLASLRSLARRFHPGGLRPAGPPCTRSRAPLRRREGGPLASRRLVSCAAVERARREPMPDGEKRAVLRQC